MCRPTTQQPWRSANEQLAIGRAPNEGFAALLADDPQREEGPKAKNE